jgi:hypothetical protein
MQGADIHTVALLLGHKDLRMAARYQHLSPAYLADAVRRLDLVFPSMPHLTPAVDHEGVPENKEQGGKVPVQSSPQRPQITLPEQ